MNRKFAVRLATVAGLGAILVSHSGVAEADWCRPRYSGHRYRSAVRLSPIVITLGNTDGFYPHRYYRRDDGCDVPRRHSIVPPITQRIVYTQVEPQIYLVNVPNRNGSFTPVTLQVQQNGTYVGPRGEVYLTRPEMDQLKQMYGQ